MSLEASTIQEELEVNALYHRSSRHRFRRRILDNQGPGHFLRTHLRGTGRHRVWMTDIKTLHSL